MVITSAGRGRTLRFMRRRRMVDRVLVAAACAALVSCASGGTVSGGGKSPAAVTRTYFLALMAHEHAKARALVCTSGWRGRHSFTFGWVSGVNPAHASARQLYGKLQPRAHRVAGGWLVSLDRERGPGSLPLFRVVQRGGCYFVCGFVKR
jgi:hypothetical protein